MKIYFEKAIIAPEKYSYSGNTSFEIKIGANITHTNFVTNIININWYLKDIYGIVVQSGNLNAYINSYTAVINLVGLTPATIYKLEIENPNLVKRTAVIYTGSVTSFTMVDENFVFPPGPLYIYGDLLFDQDTRKLFLPYDWDIGRYLGNAIIIHGSQNYVFSPKHIFTSVKSAPSMIKFVPFTGYPEQDVKIDIVPTITKINNFSLMLDPPTRLKIIFHYKRFGIINNILSYDDYKPPEEISTSGSLSLVNILDYGKTDFSNYEIKYLYEF